MNEYSSTQNPVFKNINAFFGAVDYGCETKLDSINNIIRAVDNLECFDFDEFRKDLNDELLKNLQILNKQQKADYLKGLLYAYSPIFYNKPDKYPEQVQCIIKHRNEQKESYSQYDRYIIGICDLWEYVIEIIKDHCDLYNISNKLIRSPLFKLEIFDDYEKEGTAHSYKLNDKQTEIKEAVLIKNNFDNVKIEDVYKYFKSNLVEKKYLTENELSLYLIAAFEKKAIPETLFKIKNPPTKNKIVNVFYQYYKYNACKPHGKQKKYAALLGDYFEGYTTENVSTNFNK